MLVIADHFFGYSEAEWVEVGQPLGGLSYVDLYLLFSRWGWAEYAQADLAEALSVPPTAAEEAAGLDAPKYLYLWLWCGVLWSMIEALTDVDEGRCIVLSGRLGEDVDVLSAPLKLTRNAVFHVPKPSKPYPDPRLVGLMTGTESGARLKRVHGSLGRLIADELGRRPEYLNRNDP